MTTIVGVGSLGDSVASTTHTFSALPTVSTGDIIIMRMCGGANTWTHSLTTTGVTWVQKSISNSLGGHLATTWRGVVTNGATASGAAPDCDANNAGVPQSTRMDGCYVVLSGFPTDESQDEVVEAVFSPNTTVTTTPNSSGSAAAKSIVAYMCSYSRSTTAYTSITYQDGASDASGLTVGTSNIHGSSINVDLTEQPGGTVFGGTTFTADLAGTPRSACTYVIAVPNTVPLSVNDVVGISDTGAPQAITVSMSFADVVGIVDSIGIGHEFGPVDLVGLVDSITALVFRDAQATDPVGITDNIAVGITRAVTIADVLGIIDSLSVSSANLKTVTINDVIGLLDSLNVTGPPPVGGGSLTDNEIFRLSALGYTGSVQDMRRKWFQDQVVLANEEITINDLEVAYLQLLGYTGSLEDMRDPLGKPEFP